MLGRHVPHLGFLQILLGDEPALAPYQQIYRRLIRKAVADASAVALAEIEEKGREQGLDDGMGRMVVLAEADRAQDRLSAAQVEAIVEGTDEVLDFLAADALDDDPRRAGRRRPGGPRGPRLLPLRGRPRPDRRCRGLDRRLCLAPVGPRGRQPAPRREASADDKAGAVAIT